MDLEIVRIINNKDWRTERILLRATANTDLNWFAICDNTYVSKDELSNERRNFFWFPKIAVKRGEYIRLWTGSGIFHKHYIEEWKTNCYEFYWGLGNGVWNNSGDVAVLLETENWSSKVVPKIE